MRSLPEDRAAAPARRSFDTVRPAALPAALLAVALAALMAACGGTAAPSIVVSDAWVRAPAGAGSLTAAYFTITNSGTTADTLLSVSSPAASMGMLHQSTTDPDGMTAMLPVPKLEVAAGATVRFEPGGYHVMLEGIPADTAAGATIELDLQFEHAGRVVVQATVRTG